MTKQFSFHASYPLQYARNCKHTEVRSFSLPVPPAPLIFSHALSHSHVSGSVVAMGARLRVRRPTNRGSIPGWDNTYVHCPVIETGWDPPTQLMNGHAGLLTVG